MSCSSVLFFFSRACFGWCSFFFFFFSGGFQKRGNTILYPSRTMGAIQTRVHCDEKPAYTLPHPPNTLLIAQTHLQRNRAAWHARVTRNGWELAPQLSCSGCCLAPPCTKIKPPATTSSPAEAPALHPSISNTCARSALLCFLFVSPSLWCCETLCRGCSDPSALVSWLVMEGRRMLASSFLSGTKQSETRAGSGVQPPACQREQNRREPAGKS